MPAPWRWWRCPWRARARCRSCCWAARQVHWGSAEAEAAAEGPAAVLAEGPAEEPAEGPAGAAAEPAQGPAEGPAAAAAEWLAEDWGFAEGSP